MAEQNEKKILSSRQLKTLQYCGANIKLCTTYREARDLLWKEATLENKDIKENIYVLPMGLNAMFAK